MVARAQRGQGLVEAAIVFVILLLFILGLIDFSRAWVVKHRLGMAAREGARTAVLFQNLQTNDGRVREHLEEVLEGYGVPDAVVTVQFDDPENPNPGEAVTVTVSHTWQLLYGRLLGLENGSLGLTGVAVLPQER